MHIYMCVYIILFECYEHHRFVPLTLSFRAVWTPFRRPNLRRCLWVPKPGFFGSAGGDSLRFGADHPAEIGRKKFLQKNWCNIISMEKNCLPFGLIFLGSATGRFLKDHLLGKQVHQSQPSNIRSHPQSMILRRGTILGVNRLLLIGSDIVDRKLQLYNYINLNFTIP